MPSTDLVPCFYTGQRRAIERPAKLLPRSEVHQLKTAKLGKFVDNGKVFLFFKAIKEAAKLLWDGPIGIGNVLPFARAHNYGDKLHYEMPMAGDRTVFARHRRREISVSTRVLFSQPGMQWANYVIPA